MADESDALRALLQQAAQAPQEAAAPSAGELAQQQERLREFVGLFKDEVQNDPQVEKRLKKFRREGIYFLRPWHWAAIIVFTICIVAGVGFMIVHFSQAEMANQAMRRGVEAIRAGRDGDAERFLEIAFDKNLNQPQALLQYGSSYAEREQYDSALNYLQRAYNQSGKDKEWDKAVTAAVRSARIELDRGRIEEAMLWTDSALRLDPKQREALVCRGRLLFDASKFTEARDAFQSAVEANPASLTPRYYLREVYNKLGRTNEAKVIDDFLLYAQPAGDEDIATLLDYATLLIRAGRRDEAEAVLMKVVDSEKRPSPKIMYTLGTLAVQMKEWERAAAFTDSALNLEPDYQKAYLLRGEIRYFSGDLAGALNDFQKALELSPRDPEALYSLGCLLLYDLSLYPQARERFLMALDNGFDGPFIWYNLAAANYLCRRPEETLAALNRLTPALEPLPEVQWVRANSLLLTDRPDSALALYLGLRRFRKGDPALENNLGVAHELRGDTAAAYLGYLKAVRLAKRPEDADTVAKGNIERMLEFGYQLGEQPFDARWRAMHSEIPLHLRLPLPDRRPGRSLSLDRPASPSH